MAEPLVDQWKACRVLARAGIARAGSTRQMRMHPLMGTAMAMSAGPMNPMSSGPMKPMSPGPMNPGMIQNWGAAVYEISPSIDRVRPGLFLGGMWGARQHDELARRGVTHVLCMCCYSSPQETNQLRFRYLVLNASDDERYPISHRFDEIDQFIKEGRAAGGVYVHCHAGISRAPTAVILHLMRNEGLSLQAALKQVKSVRPSVHPNPGFMRALAEEGARLGQRGRKSARSSPMDRSSPMPSQMHLTRSMRQPNPMSGADLDFGRRLADFYAVYNPHKAPLVRKHTLEKDQKRNVRFT